MLFWLLLGVRNILFVVCKVWVPNLCERQLIIVKCDRDSFWGDNHLLSLTILVHRLANTMMKVCSLLIFILTPVCGLIEV